MIRRNITLLIYFILMVAGPPVWDGFEFSVGSIGRHMHQIHNNPDILPDIPWSHYTILHAMQSGFVVSWFLTIPAVLLLSGIYVRKYFRIYREGQSRLKSFTKRTLRFLKYFTFLYYTVPIMTYLSFSVAAGRDNLKIQETARSLIIHVYYYNYGLLFFTIAVIGMIIINPAKKKAIGQSQGRPIAQKKN